MSTQSARPAKAPEEIAAMLAEPVVAANDNDVPWVHAVCQPTET